MLMYLVKIRIDEEIADEWQRWMQQVHVPDVVKTGCFDKAWIARDTAGDGAGRRAYRMIYLAPSRADYERYQERFAPDLQEDHTRRFEGRFDASREILEVVGEG